MKRRRYYIFYLKARRSEKDICLVGKGNTKCVEVSNVPGLTVTPAAFKVKSR
jgi:hypothetical protein